MRNPLLARNVLLLALVASAALARERDQVAVRTLLLSEHPSDSTHRIYVKGQVVTVLRFEQPCDPANTKLLGWEGRFEPLGVVGKRVILEPLRDLDEDESVVLLVTLADKTEVPFLLRPPRREGRGWTDQQVNVFKDRESYDSMRSALNDALKENATLREEVERFQKEEMSDDHALAALLAKGAVDQTPFIVADRFSGEDADAKTIAKLFRGKGMNSNSIARLICAILLVTATGCMTGGVSLRPDGTPGPEACPEKAREVMELLQMFVGESAWVQLDANQSRTAPITLYEGPIESVLDEDLGLLEAPGRLYGRVWTDGTQAVIRYYEAQPVRGGRKMPICAVARLGLGQLKKRPESKPGTAILGTSQAGVYIVDAFR